MVDETPYIDYIHEHGINLKSREIYLHGYIANAEEEPGVDFRMAAAFMRTYICSIIYQASPSVSI